MPSTPTRAGTIYRRLMIAALVLHVFPLLLAIHLAIRAIGFPYPIEYVEGYLLDQAARLASGETLFKTSLSSPPYVLTVYPPVFIALQVPFYALVGPAFWYGRLISCSGGLMAIVLVGLTIHRLTSDRLAAVIGAVALATAPYFVTWAPYGRIDTLALGLNWAGLYTVLRSTRTRDVIAGALLITAAAYTRQTEFVAPSAAAIAWLVANQRRGDAVRFAAIVALAISAVFIVLNAATDGGFFFNVVKGNINAMDGWRAVFSFLGLVFASPVLLVGAILCIALVRGPAGWLASTYLVCAGVVALTVAKEGSWYNYFLPLLAGSAMALGLVLWRLRQRPLACAALLGLLTLRTAAGAADLQFGPEPYSRLQYGRELEQLLEMVSSANGPVLADETAGLLPLAGRRVYIAPFEMMQMARSGAWDPAQLVREVEERRFGLILLTHGTADATLLRSRWSPQALDAVRRSYAVVDEVRISRTVVTTVYRPR